MGVPPTGKLIKATGMDIFRVLDGKLVDHWVDLDMLGIMQQLGVVPMPGQYRLLSSALTPKRS